jgi:hypothetical protein
MRCEVSFSNAERVDWLAGRGYRMVTVSASVGFTRANGSTYRVVAHLPSVGMASY